MIIIWKCMKIKQWILKDFSLWDKSLIIYQELKEYLKYYKNKWVKDIMFGIV